MKTDKWGPRVRISGRLLKEEWFSLDDALADAGFDMGKDVFSSYDPWHEEHIFVQKVEE